MFGLLSRKPKTNSEVTEALGDAYFTEEIASIDSLGTRAAIPAGTRVITEGTLGKQALVILDGEASVVRSGSKVASVGRADLVGELAVLTGKPRNASLVAETDLDAVVFTPREFDALLDDCPRLNTQMETLISRRVPA